MAPGTEPRVVGRVMAVMALLAVVIAIAGVLIDVTRTTAPKPLLGAQASAGDPFLKLGLKSGAGQAAGPSGVAMPEGDPAGFQQVFADDFPPSETVSAGEFAGCQWSGTLPTSNCSKLPRAARAKWWAYPNGTVDPVHDGRYQPAEVVTIANGVMRFHLHSDPETGQPLVAALEPKLSAVDHPNGAIRFGAYAIRYRAQPLSGYEAVFQLWPSNSTWPRDGNIAFPYGNLNGRVRAVLHKYGARTPLAQFLFSRPAGSGWHTAVVQWGPERVVFILDGRVIGVVRTRVPQKPLHLLLQTRTAMLGPGPSPQSSADIDVAWVTEYAANP